VNPAHDAIASLLLPVPDPDEDTPRNDLIREGNSYLAQGKWEEAADSFQKAASENPNDETALDALHASGRIAEGSLRDPQRASELYRKEADLARQMIEEREEQDAPAEPVKIRLARALASAGLLERNPLKLQQATQEARTDGGEKTGG
jgi:tetratricopeptide (TPR) repeat protein